MRQLGSLTRMMIGFVAPMLVLLAVTACGAHVVEGDENSVYVKAGFLSSISDAESAAQTYCQRYGKSADVEGGGELDPSTHNAIYRFDCVKFAQ